MTARTKTSVALAALALAFVFQDLGSAQQTDPIVVRAKRIYTVTKGVIENGEILMVGGKIQAIGQNVGAPATARSYSAEVVIPGMIDAHSHMALDRISAAGIPGPFTSEWKAKDHFDPKSPMIPVALSGGVTSITTRSGSGIISSGQSVAVKLKNDPAKNMILKPFVDLKMAVRPLIRLRPDQTPATQMGWYAAASEQFRLARVYLQAQEDFRAGRRTSAPAVSERLEAFAAVLRGDVMAHVHTHLPGEIMMILHLAREYQVSRIASRSITPRTRTPLRTCWPRQKPSPSWVRCSSTASLATPAPTTSSRN